ncbi:hypothetical protein ACH3XW_12580 [Acanthocheilonema viteae]
MRSSFIILLACIAFVIGNSDTEYDEYSDENTEETKKSSPRNETTTTKSDECMDYVDKQVCQQLKDEGKCNVDEEKVVVCLKTCGLC